MSALSMLAFMPFQLALKGSRRGGGKQGSENANIQGLCEAAQPHNTEYIETVA